MQILRRSTLTIGRVGSDLPRLCRWQWPPALARRDAPIMLSASAHPKQNLCRLSRFVYKPWGTHLLIPSVCVTTKCMDTNKKTMRKKVTKENTVMDRIYFPGILPNSSHCDGAIYKNTSMEKEYEVDLADRTETRLEPMQFSEATEKCVPDGKYLAMLKFPRQMIQYFSILLSSTIMNGPIQLYGYIAVRDVEDGMLNYVVNYSRDDPIIVEQGSLIEMTGPKRGIVMGYSILIEFDMRIKNGGQEEDQQLIDGAIACYGQTAPWLPSKNRITGNCGAVDITYVSVEKAVEATVEVFISEVLNGLSLSLSSFIDIMDNYEEIQFFQGTIDKPGALRRFVVAVTIDTEMLLKFKVANDVECATRHVKFQAKLDGCASHQMKLNLVSLSVKVTWSTV